MTEDEKCDLVETHLNADQPDLGTLGAGDLEWFVHVHASNFADEIEREIRGSAKFRSAFESVRIGDSVPAIVGRRFYAALRESGVGEEHIIDWWDE